MLGALGDAIAKQQAGRGANGAGAGGADPADWLVGALDQTGQALESFGREAERVSDTVSRNSAAATGAYAPPEAELPIEFSPGPAETDALVLSSYMARYIRYIRYMYSRVTWRVTYRYMARYIETPEYRDARVPT